MSGTTDYCFLENLEMGMSVRAVLFIRTIVSK